MVMKNLKLLLFISIIFQGNKLFAQDKEEILTYRKAHIEELLADPRKPITENEQKDVTYFKINKKWKKEATFSVLENEPVFQMPTYSGITRDYRKYATATFEHQKQLVTLYLYQNISLIRQPQYRDYLFLPFKDDSNGNSTYAGGRYMDVRISNVKDGKISLNFNKAYNPYCAYNDGFNCPIPPNENHLVFKIPAGERNFKSKK